MCLFEDIAEISKIAAACLVLAQEGGDAQSFSGEYDYAIYRGDDFQQTVSFHILEAVPIVMALCHFATFCAGAEIPAQTGTVLRFEFHNAAMRSQHFQQGMPLFIAAHPQQVKLAAIGRQAAGVDRHAGHGVEPVATFIDNAGLNVAQCAPVILAKPFHGDVWQRGCFAGCFHIFYRYVDASVLSVNLKIYRAMILGITLVDTMACAGAHYPAL